MNYAEIGDRIKLNYKTVQIRIKKLENKGIIQAKPAHKYDSQESRSQLAYS